MNYFYIFIMSFITFSCAASSIVSSRSAQAIDNKTPVIWSILICTLTERKVLFDRLYNKLMNQMKALNLSDSIEILSFCDSRQHTIGYKRNALLQAAQGVYVNFLDDDDDVTDNYIALMYERILRSPDVIELRGILTFGGRNPRLFIHSIKYDHYFEHKKVYYRPPNHLNTMKREIAQRFRFPDDVRKGNQGEDTDWAMQICRSKLLHTEESVQNPYYFYLCR